MYSGDIIFEYQLFS